MNYRCDLDGHRPATRGGLGDDGSSSGDTAVQNLSAGYQIKWQLKAFAVLIGRSLLLLLAAVRSHQLNDW